MSADGASRQLGVENKDLDAIQKAKYSNLILAVLFGAVIAVAAFVTGYAVSREIGPGYPYGSIGVASLAGVGKRRSRWVIALVVAVLAVFSFDIGTFVAHPTYGEGSYYGVFGRKT